jgi:hypothetical protein
MNMFLLDQTVTNDTNAAGDSVFHRLAYTGTKSSLSKSSSNLCANLLNKPSNPSNNLQAHEIDFDDVNNQSAIETNDESVSASTNSNMNKCQRSRSVDGRARLKNAQARLNNGSARSTIDYDEHHASTLTSSKVASMTNRRETQPPRLPITPRSTITERSSIAKRTPSGNNLNYTRHGTQIRTRASNGNLIDTDNSSSHDIEHDDHPYQPKIIDNRTRTTNAAQRHASIGTTNNSNHLQSSASTSSVLSTHARTKFHMNTSTHLDGKDSNASSTELNR